MPGGSSSSFVCQTSPDRVRVLADHVERHPVEVDAVPDVRADVGEPPHLNLAGRDLGDRTDEPVDRPGRRSAGVDALGDDRTVSDLGVLEREQALPDVLEVRRQPVLDPFDDDRPRKTARHLLFGDPV